jgi:hypothetical protein
VKRSQAWVTLSFLALASASFGGHFTWTGPVLYGGAAGTGTWSATVSGDKGIWDRSASAAASKTVPNATASSSVTTIFRWTVTWHADFPGDIQATSTDAIVSVFGHAWTGAKAYFRGSGPATAHGEAQLGGGWLGGPFTSSVSAVTSDVEASDSDGSLTDQECSAIAFDDASGTAIPLYDGVGYVNVAINDMVTANAFVTGSTANRPSASGSGELHGELELINVGGTSAEIISDRSEDGLSNSLQALASKRECQNGGSRKLHVICKSVYDIFTSTGLLSKSFTS